MCKYGWEIGTGTKPGTEPGTQEQSVTETGTKISQHPRVKVQDRSFRGRESPNAISNLLSGFCHAQKSMRPSGQWLEFRVDRPNHNHLVVESERGQVVSGIDAGKCTRSLAYLVGHLLLLLSSTFACT